MASGTGRMKSKGEWRKEKELEEARKAGTEPPEVDEDGKMINPHIPEYISRAPWYLGHTGPGLKHQRAFNSDKRDKTSVNKWYVRGATKGPAAKAYRKGACANCGAMTHKAKDCLERPRAVGAKFTQKDIAPDEVVSDLSLDWDAKHDRWNGYDPRTYVRVVERFEKVEAERQRQRVEAVERKMLEKAKKEKEKKEKEKEGEEKGEREAAVDNDVDSSSSDEEDSSNDEDDEGLKAEEDKDMAQATEQRDRVVKSTVRNLRIREDTAKYLRNLDTSSAYYDPKTRSMREDPNPDDPDATYHGDNAERMTGASSEFLKVERYAWEASDAGSDVHQQAAPSQAQLLFKQFQEKKEKLRTRQRSSVLDRYGGEEYLRKPDIVAQATESYVEYSRGGEVLRGQEKAVAKSKYEEDVYIGNHTSVWGSFWEAGRWGFACCHQFEKNAYCTGQAGIKAAQGRDRIMASALAEKRQAIWEKSRKHNREAAASTSTSPDSHAKSHSSQEVSEEEMEAYKRRKISSEDPLLIMKKM